MRRFSWIAGYLGTALLGLCLAYPLSTRFLATARAQTGGAAAPSDGSLPPEFMKEVEGGAPAANAPATPPTAKPGDAKGAAAVPPAPTAPAANNQAPPANVPPAAAPTAPKGNFRAGAPAQLPPTGAAALGRAGANPPAAPTPGAGAPKALPGKPASATGTANGSDDYVYDPTGRRDPFHPYRAIREDRKVTQASTEELEPLQRYDLDQLTIMGILWDVHQPRALVKDADGNMHTVVKNTKMGRSNGYVAAIREGELVLIETVDDEGRTLKRTRVMELKK